MVSLAHAVNRTETASQKVSYIDQLEKYVNSIGNKGDNNMNFFLSKMTQTETHCIIRLCSS